ncbi:MAG: DUF1492 domain-containing protein [Firmicutes bacterium]|nr:DUF1492 domain-containing protein [Bacillota bacterium]
MTAEEYLNQAYKIDKRINSELEQIASLRELATKATSTLSNVPPSGTRNVHKMEDVIAKIVDMESEINTEIDTLVDLKRDVRKRIKAVNNYEYRILLELRYLCFKSWKEISAEMGYGIRHIYRLRDEALEAMNDIHT